MTVLEYAKSVGVDIEEILEVCEFLKVKGVDDKDDILPDEVIEFFDNMLKSQSDGDNSGKDKQKTQSSGPDINIAPDAMYYANERINLLADKLQAFSDLLSGASVDVELKLAYRLGDARALMSKTMGLLNAANGAKTRFNQIKNLLSNQNDNVKFLFDAYESGLMNEKGIVDIEGLQDSLDKNTGISVEFRADIESLISDTSVLNAFSEGSFVDAKGNEYKIFNEDGSVNTVALTRLKTLYPSSVGITNTYIDMFAIDADLDLSTIEKWFEIDKKQDRGKDGKLKPTLYEAENIGGLYAADMWIEANRDKYPNLSPAQLRDAVYRKVNTVQTIIDDYEQAIKNFESGVHFDADKSPRWSDTFKEFQKDYNALSVYMYYMHNNLDECYTILEKYDSQVSNIKSTIEQLDTERDYYQSWNNNLMCSDVVLTSNLLEQIEANDKKIAELQNKIDNLRNQISVLSQFTSSIEHAGLSAACSRDPNFLLNCSELYSNRIASVEVNSKDKNKGNFFDVLLGAMHDTYTGSPGSYAEMKNNTNLDNLNDFDSYKFYDVNGNLLENVTKYEAALFLKDNGGYLATSSWCSEALNGLNYLTDNEDNVFNYLLNTGQYDNLMNYMDYRTTDISNRQAAENVAGHNNVIDKFFSSVGQSDSIHMSFKEAIARAVDYMTYGEYKSDEYYEQFVYTEADAVRDTMIYLAGVGFGDGLENFFDGFDNLFNADGEQSIEQITTSMLMQSLADRFNEDNLAYILTSGSYEISNSLGNMAPSMAISAVTGIGWLGTLAMGLSSTGNSIEQGLQAGLTLKDSIVYGVLTGASEALLESVIGGIPGLSHLNKWADLPGFGGYLASMLSEGAEESIQSILEPFFMAYATGGAGGANGFEDFKFDWNEVLKSGIYGMMTAGLLNGVKIAQTGEVVARIEVDGETFLLDFKSQKEIVNKYKNIKKITDAKTIADLKLDLAAKSYVSFNSNSETNSTIKIGNNEYFVDAAKYETFLENYNDGSFVGLDVVALENALKAQSMLNVNRGDSGNVKEVVIGDSKYVVTPEMESVFSDTFVGGDLSSISQLKTYLEGTAPIKAVTNGDGTMTFSFSESIITALNGLDNKENYNNDSNGSIDSNVDTDVSIGGIKTDVKTEISENLSTEAGNINGSVDTDVLVGDMNADVKTEVNENLSTEVGNIDGSVDTDVLVGDINVDVKTEVNENLSTEVGNIDGSVDTDVLVGDINVDVKTEVNENLSTEVENINGSVDTDVLVGDMNADVKTEVNENLSTEVGDIKTNVRENLQTDFVVSGIVGNNLLAKLDSGNIDSLSAFRDALINSIDLRAKHEILSNKVDSKYETVNLSEYVEQGLSDGSLKPIEAEKIDSVIARQGKVGDVVTVAKFNENGELVESKIEITADENGKTPWIITHLNPNGTTSVTKGENGVVIKNMEVVSNSEFESQYHKDPVHRNKYNKTEGKDKLVQITDNIVIKGSGIALAAGSFINITNSGNMQGMTQQEYRNNYRQQDRKYNGKHVLLPGQNISLGHSIGLQFFANPKMSDSLITKIQNILNNSFLKIADNTSLNMTIDDIITDLFDIDDIVNEENITSLRVIKRYESYSNEQLGIIISSRITSLEQKKAASLVMYLRTLDISFKESSVTDIHNILIDQILNNSLSEIDKLKSYDLLSSIFEAYDVDIDMEVLVNGDYNLHHVTADYFGEVDSDLKETNADSKSDNVSFDEDTIKLDILTIVQQYNSIFIDGNVIKILKLFSNPNSVFYGNPNIIYNFHGLSSILSKYKSNPEAIADMIPYFENLLGETGKIEMTADDYRRVIESHVSTYNANGWYSVCSSNYFKNLLSSDLDIYGLQYFVERAIGIDEKFVVPKELGKYIETIFEKEDTFVGMHRTKLAKDIMSSPIAHSIFKNGLRNNGHSDIVESVPKVNRTVSIFDNYLDLFSQLKTSYNGSKGCFLLNLSKNMVNASGEVINNSYDQIYDIVDGKYYIKPEYILGYVEMTDERSLKYYTKKEVLNSDMVFSEDIFSEDTDDISDPIVDSSLKANLMEELDKIDVIYGSKFDGLIYFLEALVSENRLMLMSNKNIIDILDNFNIDDLKSIVVDIINGFDSESFKSFVSKINDNFMLMLFTSGIFDKLSTEHLNYLYNKLDVNLRYQIQQKTNLWKSNDSKFKTTHDRSSLDAAILNGNQMLFNLRDFVSFYINGYGDIKKYGNNYAYFMLRDFGGNLKKKPTSETINILFDNFEEKYDEFFSGEKKDSLGNKKFSYFTTDKYWVTILNATKSDGKILKVGEKKHRLYINAEYDVTFKFLDFNIFKYI